MNSFSRKTQSPDLDAALRSLRPSPSDQLVSAIKGQVGPRRERSRRARIGAALATAGLVIAALGVGGAGYAYSSGSAAAQKSSGVHLNQTGIIKRPSSSSDAQYGPVSVPPRPPCDCASPPPVTPPPSPSAGHAGGGTSGGGHTSGQPSGSSTNTSGPPNVAGGGFTQVNKGSGNLPFTGMSLVLAAVLGLVMIAVGLVLRRAGRAKLERQHS